jgi:hypothetical protein
MYRHGRKSQALSKPGVVIEADQNDPGVFSDAQIACG